MVDFKNCRAFLSNAFLLIHIHNFVIRKLFTNAKHLLNAFIAAISAKYSYRAAPALLDKNAFHALKMSSGTKSGE